MSAVSGRERRHLARHQADESLDGPLGLLQFVPSHDDFPSFESNESESQWHLRRKLERFFRSTNSKTRSIDSFGNASKRGINRTRHEAPARRRTMLYLFFRFILCYIFFSFFFFSFFFFFFFVLRYFAFVYTVL